MTPLDKCLFQRCLNSLTQTGSVTASLTRGVWSIAYFSLGFQVSIWNLLFPRQRWERGESVFQREEAYLTTNFQALKTMERGKSKPPAPALKITLVLCLSWSCTLNFKPRILEGKSRAPSRISVLERTTFGNPVIHPWRFQPGMRPADTLSSNGAFCLQQTLHAHTTELFHEALLGFWSHEWHSSLFAAALQVLLRMNFRTFNC